MGKVIIKTEDEAVLLLKSIVENKQLDPDFQIEFDGWPVFKIHVKGRDFDGSMPTRVMPPILEIQKEVHRVYALLKYGTQNTKKLTREDRDRVEIVVKVDKGSSWYDALLEGPFTNIFRDAVSRMTPEQITSVLIASGLMVTAGWAWKHWLLHLERSKQLETSVEISKIEKEKMEIVERAARRDDVLVEMRHSIDAIRVDFASRLKPEDKMSLPAVGDAADFRVDGRLAREVTHEPREQSTERRIDGNFVIETVQSGGIRGYRLKVIDSDGSHILVTIPDGALDKEQLDILKNNEWSKKPVYMEINAKVLRGEITSATLVTAGNIAKR